MSKTHEFDDGTVVELDDDVEVEDFLNADADDISEEDHAALVAKCEAEVDTSDLDEDYEPEPEGDDLA
ncbi:hypothetical protein [Nesterenkonia haasae]|uniref:hypothetical protein n=1 Tax=Nesterenkonia haasae TaxID=2587813 RepID=UPI001391B767|nr:hypothetical protein [Nesterenkonia haasae]NDK31171.1 hypothetical protein [Nesterenkonia haasae]